MGEEDLGRVEPGSLGEHERCLGEDRVPVGQVEPEGLEGPGGVGVHRLGHQQATRTQCAVGQPEHLLEVGQGDVLDELEGHDRAQGARFLLLQVLHGVPEVQRQPSGPAALDHRRVEVHPGGVHTCRDEQRQHLASSATEVKNRTVVGQHRQVRTLALGDERLRAPEQVFEVGVGGDRPARVAERAARPSLDLHGVRVAAVRRSVELREGALRGLVEPVQTVHDVAELARVQVGDGMHSVDPDLHRCQALGQGRRQLAGSVRVGDLCGHRVELARDQFDAVAEDTHLATGGLLLGDRSPALAEAGADGAPKPPAQGCAAHLRRTGHVGQEARPAEHPLGRRQHDLGRGQGGTSRGRQPGGQVAQPFLDQTPASLGAVLLGDVLRGPGTDGRSPFGVGHDAAHQLDGHLEARLGPARRGRVGRSARPDGDQVVRDQVAVVLVHERHVAAVGRGDDRLPQGHGVGHRVAEPL